MALILEREGVALTAAERNKRNENLAKIENAINDVSNAVPEAQAAKLLAEEAKAQAIASEEKSANVQEQINQLVVDGDSSVEAAQARVSVDGTSYSTLKERLDAEQSETAGKLAETEQKKADVSYVDTKVATVASGAPSGTFATVTELQSAIPAGNNKMYLVKADGNWYFWNGSAWAAGGLYQSVLSNAKDLPITNTNAYFESSQTEGALEEVARKTGVKKTIQDTFNRPNGALGVADTGQTWNTALYTTAQNDWRVENGWAQVVYASNFNQAYIDTGLADATLSCDIRLGEGTYAGFSLRQTQTFALQNMLLVKITASTIALLRHNGSTEGTVLQSVAADFPIGAERSVKVVMKGNRIEVYVDSVKKLDVLSTHNLKATTHGLVSAQSPSTTFKNFKVDSFGSIVENAGNIKLAINNTALKADDVESALVEVKSDYLNTVRIKPTTTKNSGNTIGLPKNIDKSTTENVQFEVAGITGGVTVTALESNSKNLFNRADVVQGSLISSTGDIVAGANDFYSHQMYAYKDVILSMKTIGKTMRVAWYDAAGVFIKRDILASGHSTNKLISAKPTNGRIVRISCDKNFLSEYMVEEGRVASEYAAYLSYVVTLTNPITLRKNGTVADTLSHLGVYTKRIADTGEVLASPVVTQLSTIPLPYIRGGFLRIHAGETPIANVTADYISDDGSSQYYSEVNAFDGIFSLDLTKTLNYKIDLTDSAAKTLEFKNVPKNDNLILVSTVRVNSYVSSEFTFPASVNWKDGMYPVFGDNLAYLLLFISYDRGASWMASHSGVWAL